MTRYVVRGVTRGWLYSGQSLELALETLERDIYQCRVEHEGPTDARLFRDGALVATELRTDGTLGLASKRAPIGGLPSEVPQKWPKH